MYDLLLICSEASAASLAGCLLWATAARNATASVAILFSGEALAASRDGAFLWPRELMSQDARLVMADAARAHDLPVMLSGQARQFDVHGLFDRAREAGVPMYADPVWTDLLALRGKLADGIVELDAVDGVRLITEAKTVVGSL